MPLTASWAPIECQGTIPPASCCHSLVQYKDSLVLFGGGIIGTVFDSVYLFHLPTQAWSCQKTKNSSIVSPRLSHTAVVLGDKMVVYGGMDMNRLCAEAIILNLETFEWELLVPVTNVLPAARRSHTAVVYEGKMYVFNGSSMHRHFQDMWCLDISTSTWAEVKESSHFSNVFGRPPLPLMGHSAMMHGDDMYVFGGMCDVQRYTNRLHRYHFPTNTWTELHHVGPEEPAPRYSHISWIDNQYLYIHGGDSQNCTIYYDDTWSFDLQLNKWENITMKLRGGRPSMRSGHVAVSHNGVLYTFGGECPGLRSTEVRYSCAMYVLPHAFPVTASLVDLAARWLANSVDSVEDINLKSVPHRAAMLLKEYVPKEENESVLSDDGEFKEKMGFLSLGDDS